MDLKSNINIDDLIKDSISIASENYSINHNLIKSRLSENFVHDFRVCGRRILALLSFLKNLNDISLITELRNELKFQVKIFSPLRDTQVQILTTQQLVYDFPQLYGYYHYLIDKESIIIEKLKERIQLLNGESIIKKLDALGCQSYLKFNVYDIKSIIDIRFQKILNRKSVSNKDDLSSIHRIRLAFKKFRYTLEIASPILSIDENYFKDLKEFQTRLGLIQDNVVYYSYFEEFVKENNIKSNEIKNVQSYLVNERRKLIDNFYDNFDDIYRFWNIVE